MGVLFTGRRMARLVALALALAVMVGLGQPLEVSASRFNYAFPVHGRIFYGHHHSLYPATDIIAHCGKRVDSAVDGVVLEVSRVDNWDPNVGDGATKGGLFVSILGDDGVRYYGSHLSVVWDGIEPGVRVSAGQRIGSVGHTGNARNVCHVHFAISPPCAGTGDWWIRRGEVYPWRFLDSWRLNDVRKHISPRKTVAAWHAQHGCPAEPTN